MPNFICMTCGTQFPDSETAPAHCPICEDERQYISPEGQRWTTLEALRANHHNRFQDEEPNITGIITEPKFAIGERALLVQRPEGNILWDCISYLDAATVEAVTALGGITAIAISHPHFYSSMVEWSRAFGAPVYLHESNREYIMRPDPAVKFWSGETYSLGDDVTLIRCGGHFSGSTVLHWSRGAEGRGVILTGDTIYPVADAGWVTFLYSYPNMIPLSPSSVQHIADAVAPYAFERIYSGWFDRKVLSGGSESVRRSAARYIGIINGDYARKA